MSAITKKIFDIALDKARSALFGPKDYFERQKKRLVAAMIVPLILILGTPPMMLIAFSSLEFIEIEGQSLSLRLINEATSDALILATSVGITFCFALGVNLLYGFRLSKSAERLNQLKKENEAKNAFSDLLKSYFDLVRREEKDKAIRLGSFLCKTYPELARVEPKLIDSLVNAGLDLEILTNESESDSAASRSPRLLSDQVGSKPLNSP